MDLNEAQTRLKLINESLALAGWQVKDPSQVTEELDINLTGSGLLKVAEDRDEYKGHQFADYGLLLNGKPAAVVEAKRTSKDAAVGKEQALQYAQNIQKVHGGPLPFVFYTNGYEIFFWESDFYPPAKVYGFPTHDDLEWLAQRRETRRPLSVEMINTGIAGRDYQIAAIRKILEGIESKRRKFLLVMATGTGKTRTAAALVDALMRARWVKRVLFLVDRIALRDQALDAFKEYLPSEPRWPRKGEVEFAPNRRIYVTTYPAMLNLIQSSSSPKTYLSPHFFDLIVADESHRSIYNTYMQVLQYFNAIRLGLTATPTDMIEHNTFDLFNCELYDPTFAYTYDEATTRTPPYLCDFEVLQVRSKFQIEGIKGGKLPPAVQRKLIAEGKDIESIDFEGTDLEHKVTNSGTNALIIREFMEECIKDSSGTLPGKTIFFAISKGHARRLEELFDKMYPEHAGKMARVIVSEDKKVYGKGGLLDQFKNQDMPRIALSVDMLDTGVDIKEVVNLVFAKPVYSYVKFWQMIGRGTRLLDEDPQKRKPWCLEKDRFLIIDCWANFGFFNLKPKGKEPGLQLSLPVRLFLARLDKIDAAKAKGRFEVFEAEKICLRRQLDSLPKNNVVVIEKKADLAKAEDDSFWADLGAEDIAYLRTVISPAMRSCSEADFKALRFESEVVELGTAQLTDNHETFKAIKESLLNQVSELPFTVNVVAREKALIKEILQPDFWASLTNEKQMLLIDRLAPLMKYRRQRRRAMVHLDIEDLRVLKDWVDFGPEHERMPTKVYREKLEAYVRELVARNPVLHKIAAGEVVSEPEIQELAHILESQSLHVTEDILRKIYDHKTARFIQFIRHILGLQTLQPWDETVTVAFEEFITRHNTFSALQIQFLQTLKTFILNTGTAHRENLIERPFTNLHPQGIRGLFKPAEIEEIVDFAGNIGVMAA